MLEFKRQLWHALSGLSIALIAYVSSPLTFQSIIVSFLFASYFLKLLIKKGYSIPIINEIFIKNFGRENESGDGVMYFLIGSLITSLFFNKNLTINSIIVVSISDAVATIIGKPFGRHKLYKSKSLEGSSAFLISSLLVLNYSYDLIPSLITSFILALLELFSGFDDNAVIAPACALIMSLFQIT